MKERKLFWNLAGSFNLFDNAMFRASWANDIRGGSEEK